MRRTFHPGNNGGYFLLDAVVALFIAGIGIAAVYGNIAMGIRMAAKSLERAASIVDARNAAAEGIFFSDEE